MENDNTPALTPADCLEALLDQRYSCRSFLDDPVDRSVADRMFRMAQRSASWCNTQPWQVTVTAGESTERFRSGLQEHARSHGEHYDIAPPAQYLGVYRDRRRTCGWGLYEAVGVTRGDREASARQAAENYRLFNAPHVAVITTDAALGTYGAVDCGLYIGSLLLAAQSLGLGAVAQASVAGQSEFVRKHFDIPDDRVIVAAVSFGYPETDHPANIFRTERADIADAVTWL